jgi:hypothetical protein
MGAAVHLIEDQASPPHGANIVHDISDNFEGPFNQHGNKSIGYSATTSQAANTALTDLYNSCQVATQNNIVGNNNFKTSFSSDVYQDWLLNSDEIVTTYDSVTPGADPQYGQYGGIALGYSTDQTYSYFLFPNSVQADLYSEPPNTAFVQQSVQGGDYAYNFLEKMSRSLAPIVSELSVAGAPPKPAPAIIDTTNGSPVTFRLSENRSQVVNVNVYVQDTNQAIVTTGDLVTLSSARSADENNDSTNLPGPNTWSNMQVTLWGTLGADLTLLPFDSNLQLNWNGNVVGTPLASGTHTLCITATPYPTDAYSTTSQPVCQNFTIAPPPDATIDIGGNAVVLSCWV